MNTNDLVPVTVLCMHYKIEMSFFYSLEEVGLINLESIEETKFIPSESIGEIEKIIRLQQDLNLNLEAIDVVFNLLNKVSVLQDELQSARNRLQIYERNEYI
ncbi:chaperone modulator CbpM [Persicitalea jodogahamensis]|uniref:MerR family transcriptional regulator n=1 Tax=Persicitalea jodogahamensis TaxID=402147 RepID=A0A8J3D9X2_9BACT|nr:chaperone modulator CbpM [Persicitalea jodogahamensis]GHB80646.1 hypothetical protein GCM10007390_38820 [Persicitalea jodogahamensis]